MAGDVPKVVEGFTNRTPLTVADFMERFNPLTGTYFTRAEAQHKVNELVFGVGYKTDAEGKPLEQGLGSAAQPTPQHFAALALEAQRQAMMGQHLTPDKIGAAVAAAMKGTTGITAEMIAAAVTAALTAQPGRPKRKYQRKAKLQEDKSSVAPMGA